MCSKSSISIIIRFGLDVVPADSRAGGIIPADNSKELTKPPYEDTSKLLVYEAVLSLSDR
jgi:hypothetical protein